MLEDRPADKQTVLAFYGLRLNRCRPAEAVDKFFGASYTHHSRHVADGKDGFIAYLEWMARKYPGKRVWFVRVLAEGDFCVAFWKGVTVTS